MNNWNIYEIYNRHTKMSYIGQTKKPVLVRMSEHLKARYDKTSYLHNAMRYRPKSFRIYPIHKCYNQDELDYWERFYIKKLCTLAPNGYNIKEGGL